MTTDSDKEAQRVRDQVALKAKVSNAGTGGGTIFTESVLVVNQKAKLIEMSNQYKVFDANGSPLGAVVEINQSKAKKIARALLKIDALMTHELQVVDNNGATVMTLLKPRALFKSQLQVNNASGQNVGAIAIQLRIGKARFNLLDAAGNQVGSLNAENFRAWNFSLSDAGGNEVAKITKTWEGFAKAAFTTADNYVIQILQPLSDPLKSLAIASALGIDLILKQAQG